jgi:hypothetical protein
VDRIMDRIQRAQLSRVAVDWGGMDVYETYPARLGELWAGKPVFLLGRYRGAGEARLTLSGLAEGAPVSFEVPVRFAAADGQGTPGDNAVLASAWARKKIEALSDQMAVAGESAELAEEVTQLALRHRLMSAYTSFVAVDESEPHVDPAQPPRRLLVPVPMPEGVSYEGVFGRHDGFGERDLRRMVAANGAAYGAVRSAPASRVEPKLLAQAPLVEAEALEVGVEGGVAGGVSGGVVGGTAGGLPAVPTPAYPASARPPEAYRARGRAMHKSVGVKDEESRVQAAAAADRTRALQSLEEARTHTAAQRLDAAARSLARAAAVEQARLRLSGAPDDGTLAMLLAELGRVAAAREEKAAAALPALGRPLSLVIRNAGMAEALQAVAQAAGVRLELAPGALAGASAALGPQAVRVGYLDLRGVTAARAFTWLTQPAGLVWTAAAGRVRVADAHAAAAGPAAPATAAADADRRQALAQLHIWTWPLLAAALEGRVDDAAASELLEAWGVPGIVEAAGGSPVPLRSLWSIALARRAQPQDATLQRLWTAARAAMGTPPPAVAAGSQTPGAVYAARLGALGVEGFTAGPAASTSLGGQHGDDAFVLTAFDLRRQGGDAWSAFRETAAQQARARRASGAALQVANRLESARGLP